MIKNKRFFFNEKRKREFNDNAKQTVEEFHQQTQKPTKFTQQEFVAISPLSIRSCNEENNNELKLTIQY